MIITTGEVINIGVSSEESLESSNNLYEINIPLFNNTTGQNNIVFTATACQSFGFANLYKSGDLVYVGFMDGKFDKPVILGAVYKGVSSAEARGLLSAERLQITDYAELPYNTSFGAYSVKNIKENIDLIANNTARIEVLESKINSLLSK